MSRNIMLVVLGFGLWLGSSAQAQFTTLHYQDGVSHPFSGSSSVSGAGDVNADGVPDYIVGSPGNQFQPTDFGFVQVFSGADGTLLYNIVGDSVGDSFGFAVSGAGDVNGDGFGDFIVGIPRDGTVGPDAGSTKIFSGMDGSELYHIMGLTSFGYSGRAVAGLGDINNDAHADFAIGEPKASAGTGQGRVRVFSGIDGSLIRSFSGLLGSNFGESIANAQDVNGDGTNDLIVGVPQFSFAGPGAARGRIIVFSGVDGSTLLLRNGGIVGDRFGERVDGVGDIDGDGFDDVIGASPGRVFPATGRVGQVRVFSGLGASALYIVEGTGLFNASASLAGLGDVDGDNVPDFGVGFSPSLLGLGQVRDEVRIYSGINGAQIGRLPAPVDAATKHQVVANVGDLNGDGLVDVAVGTFEPLANTGEVRVYRSGLSPVVDFQSTSGNTPGLSLGWIPEGGNMQDVSGELRCSGATPGASGVLLVSLAAADIPIFGFDLLCAIDPFNLALVATLGASFAGEFVVPDISRRNPFLAGSMTHVQFIETSPLVQASNGIRFVVIP